MGYDSLDYLSFTVALLAISAGIFIIWVGFQIMPTFGILVSVGDFVLGGFNFFMAGFNVWIVKEKHKEEAKRE